MVIMAYKSMSKRVLEKCVVLLTMCQFDEYNRHKKKKTKNVNVLRLY